MTESAWTFLGAVILLFGSGTSLGADTPTAVKAPDNVCEDSIAGVAAVEPKLDCAFFKTTKTSRPWHIVEHDGTLENTFGDGISAEDLLLIEQTANCTSTHQGKHLMEFCDAVKTKDGVKFTLSGGMPAYASDMTVTIDAKLHFKCEFSATYPDYSGPLQWKITKKALKLKSAKLDDRNRIYGWISVEFEERDNAAQKPRTFKIEGYFKPFIQSLPKVEDNSKVPE
ncbi:MAG: hypothetical protein K8R87_07065 [Verrucomicrobia bacterium]|nr:hypothetical protein [Verrucomicrobiota bacterium]